MSDGFYCGELGYRTTLEWAVFSALEYGRDLL